MGMAMRVRWALFAAAKVRVDTGIIYYVGLAVVVVVVTFALVAFYRTWTEVREDEEPDTPEDILESFIEAHSAGEIDDQELERVRTLLTPGNLLDKRGSSVRARSISTQLPGREPTPDRTDVPGQDARNPDF